MGDNLSQPEEKGILEQLEGIKGRNIWPGTFKP
jgi:hypothetical protein